MSRRVLFAVVGIVIVSAVLSTLLLANVNADRGRDEIDYLTMHPVSLETNAALTQPVPLQRVDPYAIALPYKWVGLHPARIEARITGSDGSVLSDTTLSAAKSRAPVWLQPIGDGSVWQREAAAFLSIRVPSRATGTITLTVTRVDAEPETFLLFARDRALPPPIPPPGFQTDLRPAIVGRPNEILELQTLYGDARPAFAKAPTYVSRLQTLAPPWLPFPMPELLLAFVVAAAMACYVLTLTERRANKSPYL